MVKLVITSIKTVKKIQRSECGLFYLFTVECQLKLIV